MNPVIRLNPNREKEGYERSIGSENSEALLIQASQDSSSSLQRHGYWWKVYGRDGDVNSYTTVVPSSGSVGEAEMEDEMVDWNEEFQQLVDTIGSKSTSQDLLKSTYVSLAKLMQDFVHVCKTYAKILVREKSWPSRRKTIKPADIGGYAGGLKFIHAGIIFKFASYDHFKLYGSDENAAKAALHELKSSKEIFEARSGISVPLLAVIDYCGHRILCSSILPLDHIVYGSNNGGKHVYNSCPQFQSKMELIGKHLNIQGHYAGISQDPKQQQFLYAPCDIEGHVGIDGRSYLLDLHRLFPPECPSKPGSTEFLYRLLRPEFVKNHSKPLCSDAFSKFVSFNSAKFNQDIKEATEWLKSHHIPQLARFLDSLDISHTSSSSNVSSNPPSSTTTSKSHTSSSSLQVSTPQQNATIISTPASIFNHHHTGIILPNNTGSGTKPNMFSSNRQVSTTPSSASTSSSINSINQSSQLNSSVPPSTTAILSTNSNNFSSSTSSLSNIRIAELLHRRGINLRHLGLVRHHCTKTDVRKALLMEMVARCCKNELNAELRKAVSLSKHPSSNPYKIVIVSYFNKLIDPENEEFWNSHIKSLLEMYYPSGLSTTELPKSHSLKHDVLCVAFFKRLQVLTGCKLNDQVYDQIGTQTFEFVLQDVDKLSTRVHAPDFITAIEGMNLYFQSTRTLGPQSDRLFQMALKKLESSSLSSFVTGEGGNSNNIEDQHLHVYGDMTSNGQGDGQNHSNGNTGKSSSGQVLNSNNFYAQVLIEKAKVKSGEERSLLIRRAFEHFLSISDHSQLFYFAKHLHQLALDERHSLERDKLFHLSSEAYKLALDVRKKLKIIKFDASISQHPSSESSANSTNIISNDISNTVVTSNITVTASANPPNLTKKNQHSNHSAASTVKPSQRKFGDPIHINLDTSTRSGASGKPNSKPKPQIISNPANEKLSNNSNNGSSHHNQHHNSTKNQPQNHANTAAIHAHQLDSGENEETNHQHQFQINPSHHPSSDSNVPLHNHPKAVESVEEISGSKNHSNSLILHEVGGIKSSSILVPNLANGEGDPEYYLNWGDLYYEFGKGKSGITAKSCFSNAGRKYAQSWNENPNLLLMRAAEYEREEVIQRMVEACLIDEAHSDLASIISLIDSSPHLTSLDSKECPSLNDSSIHRIAKYQKIPLNLFRLDVTPAFLIDRGFEILNMKLTGTDISYETFYSPFPYLTYLDVKDCHKFNDLGLVFMSRFSTHIETLNLAKCNIGNLRITKEELVSKRKLMPQSLSEYFGKLIEIEMNQGKPIDDQEINEDYEKVEIPLKGNHGDKTLSNGKNIKTKKQIQHQVHQVQQTQKKGAVSKDSTNEDALNIHQSSTGPSSWKGIPASTKSALNHSPVSTSNATPTSPTKKQSTQYINSNNHHYSSPTISSLLSHQNQPFTTVGAISMNGSPTYNQQQTPNSSSNPNSYNPNSNTGNTNQSDSKDLTTPGSASSSSPLILALSELHYMGRLTNLILSECVSLTDLGLYFLVKKSPNLNLLHVNGCVNLTTNGMLQIFQKKSSVPSSAKSSSSGSNTVNPISKSKTPLSSSASSTLQSNTSINSSSPFYPSSSSKSASQNSSVGRVNRFAAFQAERKRFLESQKLSNRNASYNTYQTGNNSAPSDSENVSTVFNPSASNFFLLNEIIPSPSSSNSSSQASSQANSPSSSRASSPTRSSSSQHPTAAAGSVGNFQSSNSNSQPMPKPAKLKLTNIDLSGCFKLEDEAIIWASLACPDLQKIRISKIPQLSSKSVTSLANNCKDLTSLRLGKFTDLDDECINLLATNCKDLENFELTSAKRVSSASISNLIKSCPRINALQLSYMPQLDDSTLLCLANHLTSLKSIKLSSLYKVTSAPFYDIGLKFSKTLMSIHLDSCEKLGDLGLIQLVQPCQLQLKVLHIRDCKLISMNGIAQAILNCSSLQVLSLTKFTLNPQNIKTLGDALSGIFQPSNGSVSSASVPIGSLIHVNTNSSTSSHLSNQLESIQIIDSVSTSNLISASTPQHSGTQDACNLDMIRSPNHSSSSTPPKFISSLTSLDLRSKFVLSDLSLEPLLQSLPLLNSVDFSETKVNDKSLNTLVKYCPRIEHVNLSSTKISDEGVLNLLSSCGHSLKTLKLSGCWKCSDIIVTKIAQSAQSLKILNLGWVTKITHIRPIYQHCQSITVLNLNGLRSLGDDIIYPLIQHPEVLPNLNFFDVSSCSNISTSSLFQLRISRPSCTIVNSQ